MRHAARIDGSGGPTPVVPTGRRALDLRQAFVRCVTTMPDPVPPTLDAALTQASDELSFPVYYRDCVRPLLRDSEGRWPRCCGGGCEPCAADLIAVATRALELLGTPRQRPA